MDNKFITELVKTLPRGSPIQMLPRSQVVFGVPSALSALDIVLPMQLIVIPFFPTAAIHREPANIHFHTIWRNFCVRTVIGIVAIGIIVRFRFRIRILTISL